MKKVTILLTKYSDWVSQLVYLLCGRGYTHASLGLGDEPDTYYSFNYRGFCTETTEKHRRRGVTVSQSYELSVSEMRMNLSRRASRNFAAINRNCITAASALCSACYTFLSSGRIISSWLKR